MKNIFSVCLLFCTLTAFAQTGREQLFNEDWRFCKGVLQGAERCDYDDAGWRRIDLPHDWSIEDLPNQTPDSIVGPFDKGVEGGHHLGFVRGGTGWYRKTFILPAKDKDKTVRIHFDGVFMNTTVWLNGQRLGQYHHGYMPFYYDLTPHLRPAGEENVIAVKVENEGIPGRWYSGSGIYRNVHLCVTDPLHVSPWGTRVTTLAADGSKAEIEVEVKIDNEHGHGKRVTLAHTLLSPDGKRVAKLAGEARLEPHERGKTVCLRATVERPQLWSPETPALYQVVTELREKGRLRDQLTTTFGIRTIEFSAEKGFLLNGKRTILKGGCVHHDHGPIGAASYARAEERRIALLKQHGYNAIRTSHNPASSLLLEACDRLGMLVITEAYDVWSVEKMGNPQDYHLYFSDCWEQDIENFVARDRNHPSIIAWSIGNEIPERVAPEGVAITKMLADKFRQLDKTRPLTEAFCRYIEQMNAGRSWDETAEPMSHLDIIGYNYVGERYYKKDHQKFPARIMYGSEIYPNKSLVNYETARNNPHILGDFIWTAVDYMGEVALGRSNLDTKRGAVSAAGWPWYNANCGDIDQAGNTKPQSYYRQVVWGEIPIVMAVHAPMEEGMVENISNWGWPDERQSWTWNGCEGRMMDVRVYSRAPLVRLYLDGKLVGEQAIASNSVQADFKVPYKRGELKAVNVMEENETDSFVLNSVDEVKHILLMPEQESIKAGRGEIAYVKVRLADYLCRHDVNIGERLLSFRVSGEAEILGVGNANPREPMSFEGNQCRTYGGQCIVILRSTGKSGSVTLTAKTDGTEEAKTTIQIK